MFEVFLGEYTYEFKQERQAKKFLVEVSVQLDKCLNSLNEAYRQAVFHTQNFVFSFLDSSDFFEYNQIKAVIDERIHFILYRYSGVSNAFYFSTLELIAGKIKSLLTFVKSRISKVSSASLDYCYDNVCSIVSVSIYKILRLRQSGSVCLPGDVPVSLDRAVMHDGVLKIA
jgi:hypothetical protein